MDDQELFFAEEIRAGLDAHLTTGRCSNVLFQQLIFGMANRILHTHMIIDEIGALESHPIARPSRTKPAEEFEYPPLLGLWHKHFMQPGFIAKNALGHWSAKALKKLIKETLRSKKIPEDKKPWAIAHRHLIGGYEARSQQRQLTGEWIIFARRRGCNFYLTLGSHQEDDQKILLRCITSAKEFAELAELRMELVRMIGR